MIAKSFAKKALKATNQVARATRSAARLAGRNKRFISEVASADVQALTERAIRGVAKMAQPRRQPKRQSTPPMVKQTNTPMNVAVASETTMSAPVQRKTPLGAQLFIATAPPVLRVNNANFGDQGFISDGNKYRVYQYPLNPLCANFWQNVSDRVKQYKKYTIQSLKLDWAPNLPGTATGNVVLVYYSDPNTPPPSSFQTAQQTPDSITAQVAKEWSKTLTPKLLKTNLAAPLSVGPPAVNLPTGPVPDDEQATNRQNTQGVLYVCIGPVTGTSSPLLEGSEIGRLSMSFNIWL